MVSIGSMTSEAFYLRQTIPGSLKVIRGQGMPSYRHHQPGDLYVRLNVAFPDSIDPAKISYLENVLPPRRPLPSFPPNIHIEEASLDDLDARQQSNASRKANGEDMDDDGGEEPRVQCANQ
jgi:DnaJ homolog subfamily A member 2